MGRVLHVGPLMHRLAIAAGDPTCYRFVVLVNAWPAVGMGAADRAALLAAAEVIGDCWDTDGVPAAAAAPAFVNHIHMPAQQPHVPTGVLALQDRFRQSAGKLDADRQALYGAIMAQPSTVMHTQGFLAVIMAQPGNQFAVLSDPQVLCLTNGGVFEAQNLNITAVDKLMRALNPRLPPGLPTELEAFSQAARWIITFVHRLLGQLILDFIPRALDKMRQVAPDLMTPLSLTLFVRDFLMTHVAPAITNATAIGNVYAGVAAAATEYLETQAVMYTLLRFAENARRAAEAAAATINPRGHFGAPTNGLQRANNAAGAGQPSGQPLRPAPPTKTVPAQYTGGALPAFPHPANGSRLCYPSRSTLGRCPYATCTKQHDWTGISAAEQALIKAWLVQWLQKQRWDQYVKWSDNNSPPGVWPTICG